MNHETTLAAVRELSEQAMLRPAPTRLFCRPFVANEQRRVKPAITPDHHERAREAMQRLKDTEWKNQRKMTNRLWPEECPRCCKRPPYCHCEKSEAA